MASEPIDEWAEFPDAVPNQVPPKDEWAEFPDVHSSASQAAGAFGAAATGGALKTTAILTGMAAGAGIGTLGGLAAPLTVPLGAAIGGAAGYIAGGPIDRIVGNQPEESLPQDLRPYAVAGEAVGGSLPFAGAPLVAALKGARLPVSKVGNWINRIIDMAAESPKTFFAGEAAGITGSAVLGGVSENYAPGEVGKRVAAEIAGGFFNPTRLVIGPGKYAYDKAKQIIGSFTQSGNETQAAKILAQIIKDSGEDPKALAQLLRQSGLPGITETAAQKTGSPALAALERRLADDSAAFGAEAKNRAEDSLSTIKNMIVALRGTGEPEALTAAADLRVNYFKTLLAGRVQAAEREAVDAASRITRDNPEARTEVARRASVALENAMKDARTVESELWNKVPTDIPAKADGIQGRYQELRASMLPEEAMPAVVEGFIKRVGEGQNRTTSGELILFRSRALALAREAEVQGKVNDARIYGRLAEAAFDDLDNMATSPAFGAYGRTAEGYQDARTFSRELHDTFTRTFAGTALETGARGKDRIPPELLMRQALGSGKEAGALKMQELEEATRFLPSKGLGGPEAAQNVEVMLDAQQRIVRLAAADAIDPTTGRVSAIRLAKFERDNAELLNRFPEARADIQNAIRTETGARDMQRLTTDSTRIIENQAAFSKIAKVENPADAIKTVLNGKNPQGDLNELVKLAKRGEPGSTDGLKATVWDYALRKATSETGELSLEKLVAALGQPIRPGQPSLGDIMVSGGIISPAEVANAKKLFGEAARIETALHGKAGDHLDVQSPDGLFETVVRIVGAKIGSAFGRMIPGEGGGSSLIAAARGSEYTRKVLAKIPQGKVSGVLIEAALEPKKFAALLLEKPKTQEKGIQLARQIHAYLLQAGLLASTESEQQPPQ